MTAATLFAIEDTRALNPELMLIGSLLWGEEDRLTRVQDMLRVEDFTRADTRLAYEGILAVSASARTMVERRLSLVDWMFTNQSTARSEERVSVGRLAAWIFGLQEPEAVSAYTMFHAERVRNAAVLRAASDEAQSIMDAARTVSLAEPESLDDYLAEAEANFADLRLRSADRLTTVETRPAAGVIDQAIRSSEFPSLELGLVDLDRVIGRIDPTDLILIAARPSTGKTALMLQIALNVARKGKRSMIFSLEMPSRTLGDRLVANVGEVPLTNIRRGAAVLHDSELARMRVAQDELNSLPLCTVERESSTPTAVRAVVERTRATRPVDLVLIDYLQLMEAPHANRQENRTQELAAISRSVKRMARELETPVIALSQLSRACVAGEKPQLHHLRESGALEQDADVVLLLWLDDAKEATLCVHVAKNRNGETGDVDLYFDPVIQRVGNLEKRVEVSNLNV
jgi:replicative DNA helicase